MPLIFLAVALAATAAPISWTSHHAAERAREDAEVRRAAALANVPPPSMDTVEVAR